MSEYAIACNPGVIPWMAPTVAGGGSGPTIDSVTLADSSISEMEESLLTVKTSGNEGKVVAIEVNGAREELDLDSDVGGVRTWSNYLRGDEIGECSSETITVYASTATNTTTDTSASITVTASSPMYAALLKNVQTDIRDKLRNASGSFTFLADMDNLNIEIGQVDDFKQNSIGIFISQDDIEDYTVARQRSMLEVQVLVRVKDYDNPESTELIDLTGDVYDILMALTNRKLSNYARISSVKKNEFGYFNIDSGIARGCLMTVMVDLDHVVP